MLASCLALTPIACNSEEPDPSTTEVDHALESQPGADPGRTDEALDAAEEYLTQGEPEKAEIILENLVARAPSLSSAHEMLGRAAFLRSQQARSIGDVETAASLLDQACDHYGRAVAADPASAGLRQSAGEMAVQAGRYEEAIVHFRESGARDATNGRAPFLEANLLLQAGNRIDEARAAIDRALAIDPDEPFALATLATILHEQGDDASALTTISRARANAPPDLDPTFRVLEARLLRLAGDPRRALEILIPLEPALRAEEGVTREIAASQEAVGEPRRVIDAWVHRFSMTDDWRAAVEASHACARAGSLDEAWRWYRMAESLVGSAPELDALAEALRATVGGEPVDDSNEHVEGASGGGG